jgi:hypothetical protein
LMSESRNVSNLMTGDRDVRHPSVRKVQVLA